MSYLKSRLPEFSPAVVELEPWRKALMDAAEYIRVHGHCRGATEDLEGRVCAIGALGHGGQDILTIVRSIAKLGDYLGTRHIAGWNDRTPTDRIIAALEAAARS